MMLLVVSRLRQKPRSNTIGSSYSALFNDTQDERAPPEQGRGFRRAQVSASSGTEGSQVYRGSSRNGELKTGRVRTGQAGNRISGKEGRQTYWGSNGG